jgi:hypothetical protein
MGKLNILKGSYTGKVGVTVGAKWKSVSTVRSYTKPAYTNTPEQQVIRSVFGDITHYVSLFADQSKKYGVFDTKSMTYRNAIIHENRSDFTVGAFDPSTLLVSKGGLPQPILLTKSAVSGSTGFSATWNEVVGPNITGKSKVVVILVDATNELGYVGAANNSAGTITIPGPFASGAVLAIYYYLLDFRGSRKVGSRSKYDTVTVS